MTLNDLELRNSSYFAFFTEFDCFPGQLFTVVEDIVREILSLISSVSFLPRCM